MVNRSISLRYKILIALTALPLVGLSLFLFVAVDVFEKDKIAYVFDSSLSVSKTKAARVRSELNSLVSVAQSIVLTYSRDNQSLSESGQVFFDSEKKLESLELYFPSADGKYVRNFEANKLGDGQVLPESPFNQQLIDDAKAKAFSVIKVPGDKPSVRLALRFGKVEDPNHVYALVTFNAHDTADAFNDVGNYTTFLIRGNSAQSLFAPPIKLEDGQIWQPSEIWNSIANKAVPDGIQELKSPNGQSYLVSFSTVGLDDLKVVAAVDKEAALKAVNDLIVEALLMLFIILGVTIAISVIASKSLTSALGKLVFATQKVSQGDFNIRVEVKSKDEFGDLANSFNVMAEEVSRLMLETAEKARMESELATAKTVQETLFPEPNATIGPVQISGHYTPASECGGDWWYHCEIGDKVYVWIGDATGHGAPAALLTSAVRAVVSVIEVGEPRSPAESIGLLNRAIADTSKGKLMMTFFLGCIDKATGTMTYVNASHEPPLLLRKTEGSPSRSDFEPLNEVNNPRLGEVGTTVYKQATVKFEAGDQLVLYTDGVTDIKSPEAKAWGERKFLKALSNGLFEQNSTEESVKTVIEELQTYRQGTPLDDDVTLIIVQYGHRIIREVSTEITEAA